MNILDNFHLKKNNNRIIPSYNSHKFIKNRKYLNFNKNINRDIFKNSFSNYFLPQIKNSSSLDINKRFFNKNIFNHLNQYQIPKNSDKIIANNLSNSSIFQINNNIISIKKKALIGNRIKPKFNYKSIQKIENSSDINNYNNNNQNNLYQTLNKENIEKKEKEIKEITKNKTKKEMVRRSNTIIKKEHPKEFIKTVNIYFKNNFRNNESTDDDINFKKEDNKITKTKSMFMTGMNFLMPNNSRNNKNKEKNENNVISNDNKRNEENSENKEKINYDYLSFKELLKHIEENKKKIIDNQNDIEDMLLTAKDTHIEIWKCNHYKK